MPPPTPRRLCDPARRRLLRALALAPLGATWAAAAAAQAGLIAPSVCRRAPELAEGPFYLDARLLRVDVTDGRPGVPVDLALQVVDVACAPIPGARVDLWHCDAQGVYSATAAAPDTTFLRGTQMADAAGIVRFRTIWPGWYPGRTPHFHFKAILDGGWTLTSQAFLPDALSAAIYAGAPAYAGRGERGRIVNAEDRIALAAGAAAVADVRPAGAGQTAALVVAVDPAAAPPRPRGRPAG